MALHISILTIKHANQLYPTVGNYKTQPDGSMTIWVSDMGNWKYELLVALHELIEFALIKDRSIAEKDIDAFDIAYEKNRPAGDVSEPGDDLQAPYYHEHQFATNVEKRMAMELNIDWAEYDKEVNGL